MTVNNDELIKWLIERGDINEDVIADFNREKMSLIGRLSMNVHAVLCHKDHARHIEVEGIEPNPNFCNFYVEEITTGESGVDHKKWMEITSIIIDRLTESGRTPQNVIEIARCIDTINSYGNSVIADLAFIVKDKIRTNIVSQGMSLPLTSEPQKP